MRAVGITLSDDQHAYVSKLIAQRGLSGRVEVRRMDYRDVLEHGSYDKITALWKPGGLVLNHGITTSLPETGGLDSGISEFIDEYVFPGGELVHAADVLGAAAGSGLECLDAENLRPHYGKTLWHWVTRLEQHADEARRLIGEQKYRIWRIYMAGSAYAFDRGWMELWQVLAGKGVAGSQPNFPFKRDFIYRGE